MNTLFYNTRDRCFIHKVAITIATVVFSLVLLASCDVSPIFAAIEDETAISKGSVNGTIFSLVEAGGDLWVTNGYLFKKTDGSGSWNKQSLPGDAHRCAQLATDGSNVYALLQNDEFSFHSLYWNNGSNWAPVPGVSKISAIFSGNNSIFAFSKTADGSYTAHTITAHTITDTTVAAIPIATSLTLPKGSAVASGSAYFATATHIFNDAGTPVAGEGAPTAGIISLTSDGANLFVLTSGLVYRYDGTAWTSFTHGTGGASSITWLGGGTTGKNLLLISGSRGFGEIVLNTDGTFAKQITPGSSPLSSVKPDDQNNYANTIGNSPVNKIFAVTSPVPNGNDYVIYTAVSKGTLTGLWSYYNNTSSIWDRE